MKLIFCPKCQDVIKLISKMRFCDCKQSSGIVEKDGLNAKIFGESVPLGFQNTSFLTALNSRGDSRWGNTFTAFVIPYNCPTINSGILSNQEISNA